MAVLGRSPLPVAVPVPPMSDEVTRILSAIEQGDSAAAEQLLPLVYNERRQVIGKFEEPRLKDNESIFAGELIAGKEGSLAAGGAGAFGTAALSTGGVVQHQPAEGWLPAVQRLQHR